MENREIEVGGINGGEAKEPEREERERGKMEKIEIEVRGLMNRGSMEIREAED